MIYCSCCTPHKLNYRISSPLKRPNRLPFTEYAFKCAASLKETAEYDSDQLFPPLIRLQRILEQTRDFYDTEGSKAISQVHVHAKRLHSDLQEWRYGIPDSTLRYGKTLRSSNCFLAATELF